MREEDQKIESDCKRSVEKCSKDLTVGAAGQQDGSEYSRIPEADESTGREL